MIKEALSYVRGVNGSAPRYGAHMDLDRRGGVGGAHMGLDGFFFFSSEDLGGLTSVW